MLTKPTQGIKFKETQAALMNCPIVYDDKVRAMNDTKPQNMETSRVGEKNSIMSKQNGFHPIVLTHVCFGGIQFPADNEQMPQMHIEGPGMFMMWQKD